MADEKIVIKIDVDARTTSIEKTTQAVKRLKREAGKFSSGRGDVNEYLKQSADRMDVFGNRMGKMKRHFDFMDKGVKMLGGVLKKFLLTAIKGVIAEMALMGAAMLGIHAMFLVGKGLAKAYSGAMQVLAGGAAAAAVALGTAAAAVREQQAAMYAYRGKGAKEFGSGLSQARVAMRALQMDASLAGLGVANLNKAYATMSKTMSTPQINASTGLFKALMDFGSAGQDPGAAAEKVGAVIAALSDKKKSLADVTAAAKAVGPEMQDALKKANVKTKEQLKQLLMSGELAKLGGVAGQFDAVNQTLIGQIKTFFNLVKGQFADFGLTFLEPAKVAMQKIFKIIQRDLGALTGIVSEFGTGSFMDGLVGAVDKVSSLMVNLIQKYLPMARGMGDRIGSWWERFQYGWRSMVDAMRPFIEGAKVLESAFKPIWEALKGGTKNFFQFNDLLQENRDDVLEFGTRIGEIITAVSEFSMKLKSAFFTALPIINDVLSGVKQIFNMLSGIMTLGSKGNMFGALLPLVGMFIGSRAMSATKGGFLPTATGTMNVTAQSVNVAGPGVGGPVAPGGPSSGGFASGGRGGGGGGAPAAPVTYKQALGMTSAQRGGLSASEYATRSQAAANAAAAYSGGGAYSSPGLFSKMMAPASGPLGDTTFAKPAYAAGMSRKDRFATFRQRMRYNRSETAFGAGLFGNEKLGIKGINNSVGMKMGTALALGMASQYAPEEMRGALALGGTIGMINPMAGLAVGGLGSAMKARGAGKGALAGMAGGAALGSFFGPYGMAIGAGLGLLAGGIMGGVNEIKAKAKEARQSIKNVMGSIMVDIFSNRSIEYQDNMRAVAAGQNTKGRRGSLEGIADSFMSRTAALNDRATAALTKERFGLGPVGLGAGLTGRNTGIAKNRLSITGFKNSALDVMNSNIMPMQMATAIGSAIMPDFLNLGALGGKLLPDFVGNTINKIPGSKMFKSMLGLNVKSDSRDRQEELLKDIFNNQTKYGLKMTEDELKKALKDPGNALTEFQTQIKERGEAFKQLDDVNAKRLDVLEKMSGKSRPELEALAKEMGVNLYDATIKFDDMVTKLKLNMIKSAAEMQAANQDVLLEAAGVFDVEIKRKKAEYAINEKTRVIADKAQAGALGSEELMTYMQGLGSDFTALYGGDSLKAFQAIQGLYGKGGTAFQAGGALAGQEALFTDNAKFQEFMGNARTGLIDVGATQLGALINKSGKVADVDAIKASLGNLSDQELFAQLGMLQQGAIPTMGGTGDAAERKAGGVGMEGYLKTLGIDYAALETVKKEEVDKLTDLTDASKNFKDAVEEYKSFTKEFFGADGGKPEWWSKDAMKEIMKGDTSSPRGSRIGDSTSSRLSQTMARHAAINSQLTGSRSITSAYRTFGLGSPSSDHATGRAYDLVGQNLGAYSRLVHANGGFAEFHGRGGSRHLHVVPGPGPFGDTPVPSMYKAPQMASVSSGTPTTNNITINASPGQSPEAIANAVMRKIDERNRNKDQRR